jgi:hypothetical protein
LATPEDVLLPVAGEEEEEEVEEVVLELLDELHAASMADTAITAADDSHRLPGSLIAPASKYIQFTTVV